MTCPRCGAELHTAVVHHANRRTTRWIVCPNGHSAPHSNPTPKPDTRHLEAVRP